MRVADVDSQTGEPAAADGGGAGAGLADQDDKRVFARAMCDLIRLHDMAKAARSALSQLLAEPFSPRCRQNARFLLDEKLPAKPAAPRAPKQPTSTS